MLCPKCQIDWEMLKEMIQNNGENRLLAEYAIMNCKTCWQHLGHLIEPQVMTIDQFNKLDKMPENKVKVVRNA